MTLFKVDFLTDKKWHSAIIHRVAAEPNKGQVTLYTTHEIKPALPIQMITFAAVCMDRLRWQVPTEQTQVANLIAESIMSKVSELGLPLSDRP